MLGSGLEGLQHSSSHIFWRKPLNDALRARLEAATDRNVTVGLRPSSFTTDTSSAATMDLRVVVAEYLGAQSVLVTKLGDTELLVETQSTAPFKSGVTQTFGVNTDEIMLFDRTTGLRL